jgi:FkbM family methyltransferase
MLLPSADLGASKLIIDIGMNDATDTLYFLHRGYTVVAVEADPTLVARVSNRPAIKAAIDAGRLIIEQKAIGSSDEGEITFYKRLDSNGEQSSIHKSACETNSIQKTVPKCDIYTVPLVTCVGLVRKYKSKFGVPWFLKVHLNTQMLAALVLDSDFDPLPSCVYAGGY